MWNVNEDKEGIEGAQGYREMRGVYSTFRCVFFRCVFCDIKSVVS